MLELAPGTALGAYVINARLGRGGMAVVYQAHHAELDRHVAIKVLWPSLADTPGFLERFRREARAASRLRHPNILTVYDFGSQDGITYMVTELLPGGSLADRLGRPLNPALALRVVQGIGAALDLAHANGLIHRDVKPSNILFTREGEPVLADFGIARVQDGQHITVQGSLIGTPHYMAPEMAAGQEATAASDLYSLGVVLYEMLAGSPPFPRPTPIATVRAHVYELPPPIPTLNPGVSDEVDAAVARALSKSPGARYPTGAGLAEAFQRALDLSDRPTPRPSWPGARPVVDPTVVAPLYPGGQDPTISSRDPPRPSTVSAPAYVANSIRVRPARRPGRARSTLPLVLLLLVVSLAAMAGTFIWRYTGAGDGAAASPTATNQAVQPVASPLAPTAGASPGGAAEVSASAASATAVVTSSPPPAGPAASPEVVVFPTATARQEPTPPPPTAPPAPTPTADTRRGPLGVQIASPANGERVPARPHIVGRRVGSQAPDAHLWIMIHPRGGPDNWWPYKQELIPDRDGNWVVDDVEIGGPSGSEHDLAIGVADAQTNQLIVDQIRLRQDEPFVGGLPPGFRELARITVVKR